MSTDTRPPGGAAARTGWAASRIVLALGAGLTLLVAAGAVSVGVFDHRAAVQRERHAAVLMARVIEEHASRTVDTAALALASLDDRIAAKPHAAPAELVPELRETLAALPFVRSFALVDARGALLASTTAGASIGGTVDPRTFGNWPAPGEVRLGTFVAGRSLAELARPASSRPAGVGFIPLTRAVRTAEGDALLVALLNPDAFSNFQALTLADTPATALLAGYSGDVLATSSRDGTNAGERIDGHEVFRTLLAQREHASFVGAGRRGERDIVAFRASRSRPLVALVEHPMSAVTAAWWQGVKLFAALGSIAVLLLGGMTVVAWRGLGARERAREQLDAAHLEIAQRERELSVTIKSVQELIFRTDASGRITYVNTRWTAIGGTTVQDAIGRRIAELAVPEQQQAAAALFSTGGGARTRSAQITVKSPRLAESRVFDVAVVPLVRGDRVVGFAGSAVDVTDRVTAQRRLQTQLAVTELMLEISPLPLVLRDTEGRFVSVNQAWEDFTGLRRADVIGRETAPHVTAEEHETHRERDRELLVTGGRVRYESRVTHSDGSRRDAVFAKVLVPGDGGQAAGGILTVMMDVSEFRAAERATREARDAAEDASRAKSEFVANISHELRTPLQSILGFSELGVVRGSAQPKLAQMFEEIHASGQRMLALVSDLLDVARIESTVGTFDLERADLRPLVRGVARELGPLLAGRGVHIEESLGELPLVAKVDPTRFQQVVRNVLANAIRFSPAHGRIDLHGAITPAGEICLRIADRGPGIPPAEIDRIFDAFVQSSRTKDGSGGTGLGLTISRKILEVHGGRIHAENRPEGGAVFTIHLPLKAGVETAPAPLQ